MVIFDYISKEEITEIISKLISIESHKDWAYFETTVAEHIKETLEKEGISCEIEEVLSGRPNVYAYLGEKTKSPELMFNGHTDTIPGFSMDYPAYDPFIKDGVIYGRGACDMKGGIAGFMAAFIAAKRAGLQFKKTAMFAGVIGEEECSQGTEHLIKTDVRPNLVVVGEPTEVKLCTAHKGFEWVEVTMIGRSCHGSKPKAGKNAIYAAAYFCELVQTELEPMLDANPDPLLGPGTICVGVIEGGHDPNIVPDRCTMRMDRRFMAWESLEKVYGEIEALAKKAAEKYDCEYKWRPFEEGRASMINMPHALSPDDPFVVESLKTMEEVLGTPQTADIWPAGWTDAGLLSNYTPAKCFILGPGDVSCAHANYEYCPLEEVYQCSEIYFKLIEKFCV